MTVKYNFQFLDPDTGEGDLGKTWVRDYHGFAATLSTAVRWYEGSGDGRASGRERPATGEFPVLIRVKREDKPEDKPSLYVCCGIDEPIHPLRLAANLANKSHYDSIKANER